MVVCGILKINFVKPDFTPGFVFYWPWHIACEVQFNAVFSLLAVGKLFKHLSGLVS